MAVHVRRIYDDVDSRDGMRVLVDRIWPRGVSKERAALDEWCKDVAPSTELRKWYAHDPGRFDEFARRYRTELGQAAPAAALEHLREIAEQRPLILLTATRAVEISAATVLASML